MEALTPADWLFQKSKRCHAMCHHYFLFITLLETKDPNVSSQISETLWSISLLERNEFERIEKSMSPQPTTS